MNRNGQTLVVFVLLIPLFMVLAAFIVDNSMIVSKSLNLKNTTRDIIRSDLLKEHLNDDEIKELFKKNKIPTKELVVIRDDENSLKIYNHYFIDSIFGKVVGINSYELEIEIIGKKQEDKVYFE